MLAELETSGQLNSVHNVLLDAMCKEQHLIGIAVFYQRGDSYLNEYQVEYSKKLEANLAKVIEILKNSETTDQGARACKLSETKDEGADYYLFSIVNSQFLDGKVLLVCKRSNLPLEFANFLGQHIVTNLLAQKQNKKILDLQADLRHQTVWSESIEWVKNISIQSENFIGELLHRFEIMLNINHTAAIFVTEEQAKKQHVEYLEENWHLHRIDFKKIEKLQQKFPDSLTLKANKPALLDFSKEGDFGFESALIVPMLLEHKVRAIACLFKVKGQFTEVNKIHVTQILGMLSNVFERASLIKELGNINRKLIVEKKEQDALIGRLKNTQDQLLQSEKMASIGQLAAGVAHEINNPIGYVSSNLTSMKQYVDELLTIIDDLVEKRQSGDDVDKEELGFVKDDVRDLFKESFEGINRVKTIVQDLKDFSHSGTMEKASIDLMQAIESTLNIVQNEIKYKCEIVKDFQHCPPVECVASQINQVIMNLLVNAGHAIEEKGIITITVWSDSTFAYVKISDTGKGIEPEHLKRIFDPFFTTKPIGKGTGLGLSISYGIIQNHDGALSVDSVVGKGSSFTIQLPIG